MCSIENRIEELKKELLKLESLVKDPPFIIGEIYGNPNNDNCRYTFIDWNGEVRLLNITNSHMWKPIKQSAVKSAKFRQQGSNKVKEYPKWAAIEAYSSIINQLYLIK